MYPLHIILLIVGVFRAPLSLMLSKYEDQVVQVVVDFMACERSLWQPIQRLCEQVEEDWRSAKTKRQESFFVNLPVNVKQRR